MPRQEWGGCATKHKGDVLYASQTLSQGCRRPFGIIVTMFITTCQCTSQQSRHCAHPSHLP